MNNNPTLFDNIPEDDILSGVRVFFCGRFTEPVSILADQMENRGAIVRSISTSSPQLLGLSKETCVIVQGNSPKDTDLDKIQSLDYDGFHIPVISEEDAHRILDGSKEAHFPKPIKEVDITYDFIFQKRVIPPRHTGHPMVT